MGDPKKTKKHYETPRKPYDKKRLERERETVKKYGLKSKRELWRFETILRKKRENARKLLALDLEERLKREKELLESLAKLGLLSDNSTLDDVLTLSTEGLLERRLQTMVLRKGLANTPIQARQFITHGHIAVNGKRVDAPSFLVLVDAEKKIGYYGKPMEIQLKEPEVEKKAQKEKGVKKDFEAALPEEEKEKKEAVKEAKEKKPTEEKKKEEVKEEKKEKAPKEEKTPAKEEAAKPKKEEEVKTVE